MYRNHSWTPLFPEFGLPFQGHLDPDNRWVQKAALIPWPLVERLYHQQLGESSTGAPAFPARMAFGALVIKEELRLSDIETVQQISENPYLQYFIGLQGFQNEAPFDPSLMVYFRKRFPLESMNRINEALVLAEMKSKPDEESAQAEDSSLSPAPAPSPELPPIEANPAASPAEEAAPQPEEPQNQGKLLLDATCTPADIRYPTDLSLLNEAREKTEEIIDRLHQARPQRNQKPRTYRRKARKEYLAVAKQKRPSRSTLRKGLRQQLGYLRRNLKTIARLAQPTPQGESSVQDQLQFSECNHPNVPGSPLRALSSQQYRTLLVVQELYRQQKIMYETQQKRIDDRIVSLWFPEVRPIKRGKAGDETEFGAKLHVSLVQGFTFAERIEWNNFNESTDLVEAVERYRQRFGFYPVSVHADRIYRTRGNLAYCHQHGIRLSGPRLGRPPQDESVRREQKKLTQQDERDRIPIEGKFGEGKRRYGLGRIMAKLAETSLSVIGINVLVMNLGKLFRLGRSKDLFLCVFAGAQSPGGVWGLSPRVDTAGYVLMVK